MRPIALLPFLALAAVAPSLTIGDAAPPLKPAEQIKGKPANLAKGLHVVEFWALSSPPCRAAVPTVAELTNKYKGKVDFTAVSVYERGDDALAQLKSFVAAQGDKVPFNVSFDAATNTAGKNWVEAARQSTIPIAFLVKDGKIQWIGHPAIGLDKAIDATLAHKLDLTSTRAAYEADVAERQENERREAAIRAIQKPAVEAALKGDVDGALAALDKAEERHPEYKLPLMTTRFSILVDAGDDRVLPLAKSVVEQYQNPILLNQMAWTIIDPKNVPKKPNYAAALVLAQAAAEASEMKDASILDTYALSLFRTGDKAKALEVQTKAVALAKTEKDRDPDSLKELEERLEEFKKAVG